MFNFLQVQLIHYKCIYYLVLTPVSQSVGLLHPYLVIYLSLARLGPALEASTLIWGFKWVLHGLSHWKAFSGVLCYLSTHIFVSSIRQQRKYPIVNDELKTHFLRIDFQFVKKKIYNFSNFNCHIFHLYQRDRSIRVQYGQHEVRSSKSRFLCY